MKTPIMTSKTSRNSVQSRSQAPTWHSTLTWYIVEHSMWTEKQAEKNPNMTSPTNRNRRDYTETQTPRRHIT